jgi:hypothetical protein
MPYRTMGWIHATVSQLLISHSERDPDRRELGQGTVEYVGLMLLLATLLTGVVVAAGKLKDAGLAKAIAAKLKETIDAVGSK